MEDPMNARTRCVVTVPSIVLLLALQLVLGPAQPAAAAAGDLIADVVVPGPWPTTVAPSVAFDGQNLYYVGYAGSTLHRVDMPPAGGTTDATGHVEMQITGATGIMTLSYDVGRDAFWAVGGDGSSIYLLDKAGAATLVFTVTADDRPNFHVGPFPTEVKIAYDRSDDTIWYSPDATARIYHYHTHADALGTAELVSGTPFIDVDAPPNDTFPQCGYNQSSGVATGGANLFITVSGCPYYFEYTKTGTKVAYYAYNLPSGFNVQDAECDDRTYGVPVFWIKDGFNGHIRAFEQPAAGACAFGGGTPAPVPPASGFPVVESLTPSAFPIQSTSHAVAMPESVAPGDLLLAIFSNHGNATVTTPAGWTVVGTTANTNRVRTGIYARNADGTEGGTTVNFVTTAAEPAVAHVYGIAQWSGSGTITNDVQASFVIGAATAPDPPALDPSTWGTESTLWLAAYGAENLGRTSGYPTSYTDGRYDESGGLVGRASTASARRASAVASEDPAIFRNDFSQPWVAVTIGIRPGSGGSPPPPPPPPSGASPVVLSVTASSFASDTTDHAVVLPATVEAGDLLIGIFASDGDATSTTPSGWTSLGTNASGTAVRLRFFVRRASGDEDGTTVNLQTSAAEQAAAQVYRIQAGTWRDSGTLASDVTKSAGSGSSATPDPSPLDPVAWDVEHTRWT